MFTTVIGSYPLSYSELGKEAIIQSVKDQLEAGIDLVSDGQTRYDMVEYFARAISGYSPRAAAAWAMTSSRKSSTFFSMPSPTSKRAKALTFAA